jgi:mono/diheme cytochrome c family protein
MVVRQFTRLLAAISLAVAVASGCRAEHGAADLESGGQAYLAQCAVCHGLDGHGDGPLASSIAAEGKTPPPPLDSARVASLGREGVRKAIESGVHGSPMPVWGPHLGPVWMDRIAEYVVAAPAAGAEGRAARARYLTAPNGAPPAGRRAYVVYCSGCHGPQGGGDGFFSPDLGTRLKPSPLRGEPISKLDEAGLSKVIGLGGAHAPNAVTMPGWLYTMSPDDRQALARYLRVLAGSAAHD